METIENEKIYNYGKEFLKVRRNLKISQKDFAKIAGMTQEELDSFEKNNSNNLVLNRIKITIGLNNILEYFSNCYPVILKEKIIEAIEYLNPFESIEQIYELINSIVKNEENIENFVKQKVKKI